MKKFTFTLIISFLGGMGLFCFPTSSLAINTYASVLPATASVSFETPTNVHVGDTFSVLLDADTAGVLVNSVNISLNYDTNLTSFAGYKDNDTLVKIWIEAPHDNGGTISMGGIIPGGVSGLYDPNRTGVSPIPVVHLLFLAKGAGDAKLTFIKAQILKNDGKGTELSNEQKNSSVTISNSDSLAKKNNINDNTPPEPFTLTFLESSWFGSTPNMIVFEAHDADSGIKGYKMSIDGETFQNVQSPVPIMKSLLARDITVRAFDFYGNFRDANLTIPGIVPLNILLIILILLIFAGILGFKLLKYKA